MGIHAHTQADHVDIQYCTGPRCLGSSPVACGDDDAKGGRRGRVEERKLDFCFQLPLTVVYYPLLLPLPFVTRTCTGWVWGWLVGVEKGEK